MMRGGRALLGLCLVAGGTGAAAEREQGSGVETWLPRLRVGMWVKVEGQLAPDGTLQASRIKVYGGELDEVAVESELAAVDLARMTVQTAVGVRVVATASTEIEGPKKQRSLTLAALEVGDRVKIEGNLQKDGSLLAQEIDIDKSKRPPAVDGAGSKHELTAPIESIDTAGHRISVLGVSIRLSGTTRVRSPLPD